MEKNKCPNLLVSNSTTANGGHNRYHSQQVKEEEEEEEKKDVEYYEHTLPSRFPRWTAKESFEFMGDRPWHHVHHFYSNIIFSNASSSSSSSSSSITEVTTTTSSSPFSSSLFFSTITPPHSHNNKLQTQQIPTIYEDDDDESSDDASFKNGSMNPSKDRHGRWARVTFKILLSYHGPSFDGWQKQPGLHTVQRSIESCLGTFVDERKAQSLKDKSKPLQASVVVAGRTDKGVSALNQLLYLDHACTHDLYGSLISITRAIPHGLFCMIFNPYMLDTWRKDVKPHDVEDAINNAAPGKLRAVSVSEVSREFHPNFSAKWRRYLYIFPLKDGENMVQSNWGELGTENFTSAENCGGLKTGFPEDTDEGNVSNLSLNEEDMLEGAKKPRRFSVTRVDQLLRQVEGKLLSYKVFARDTKASRNIGPPTECFLYHARAAEARLSNSVYGEGLKVMAVELVGNRFLRKMVRVLVATSIREAAAGTEVDALVKLMDATCRRATAPPAPPDGLCLVDVGYTSFKPKNCLIH